jgi:hypothetical protein
MVWVEDVCGVLSCTSVSIYETVFIVIRTVCLSEPGIFPPLISSFDNTFEACHSYCIQTIYYLIGVKRAQTELMLMWSLPARNLLEIHPVVVTARSFYLLAWDASTLVNANPAHLALF